MTDLTDVAEYPPGSAAPGSSEAGFRTHSDVQPAGGVQPDAGPHAAHRARTLPSRTEVLIVGAGFAGLAAVIGLTRAGYSDIVVIDRGEEVGGTWRDNTYPGAACDVPSQLYSFSFALNPDWSRSYSPQPEIQRYTEKVTDEFGVRRYLHLGVELTAARWDAESSEWQVQTSAGPITARTLVLGIGALCEPKLPDIPGIDSFEGDLFHSARWDHDTSLAGKRIAVIGTGASAIQIVPQVAKIASHLDVYQRTAPWIMPRHDREYGRIMRAAMKRIPGFQRLTRELVYWWLESRVVAFVKRPRLLEKAQRVPLAHMHKAVADPELRRKLTPDYPMGCKRILISNNYYPAIAKPTTELVTDPIAEIKPHSIVTKDGTERPIDVLVVATGFFVTDNPTGNVITGTDGRTLTELWDENGMKAYRGTAVAGFPNMFYLLGPNTGLGHSSMIQMAESQVTYLVDAVKTMHQFGLDVVEVRRDVYEKYGEQMRRRFKGTVWAGGNCASWYNDKNGDNTTLWPGFTFAFRRMTERFDLGSYRSTAAADTHPTARQPRTAFTQPDVGIPRTAHPSTEPTTQPSTEPTTHPGTGRDGERISAGAGASATSPGKDIS